jgi:hypothetical protein
MSLSIHNLYGLFFRWFRPRRMRRFARQASVDSRTHVLDVGGHPDIWSHLAEPPRLTMVNLLFPVQKIPGIQYVIADGRRLPFRDAAFELVYSNSVIEHVGEASDQHSFASEIVRVARRGYFVQTPNRWFPVEPHLLTPLIHFLPRNWQRVLIRNFTVWGLVTRPSREKVDAFLHSTRLLSHWQMARLFPYATISSESFLLLRKALIASESCAAGSLIKAAGVLKPRA